LVDQYRCEILNRREDPALQGELTITIPLVDADGGTDVLAVHDGLPSGLSAADNELAGRCRSRSSLPWWRRSRR
jgi:hypothetical protein